MLKAKTMIKEPLAMLNSILVPLDGSALAARALPFAARLARSAASHLILVRAHLPNGDSLPPRVHHADQSRAERATLERDLAHAELRETTDQLRRAGLEVEPHFVDGAPAEAILTTAVSTRASLIVMSTHGHGGLGRWLYGSVADEVLRRANVPVLIVSATAIRSWSDDRPIRVLVPLDGSAVSQEILTPTAELASMLSAEIRLVSVVEPPVVISAYGDTLVPPDPEAELAEAERSIQEIATQLRSRTAQPVAVRVAYGDAVATITQIARDEHADVIAMGTHGRSGVARLVMGSVATRVLQCSGVPLLLHRPAGVRDKTADLPPALASDVV
jgi:nucleotide-binding universal stress UspA family protein